MFSVPELNLTAPGESPRPRSREATVDYASAEAQLGLLVDTPNLDEELGRCPAMASEVDGAIESALEEAYGADGAHSTAEHLFLQRALYRVNRLKLFWYDDLARYDNERSQYLRSVRDRIESRWQRWELETSDLAVVRSDHAPQLLRQRAAEDLDPPPSAGGRFFRDQAGDAAYRKLLAIASLDGLVEASQLSRTLGGVSNEVQAMLTRLFMEEYGCGRLPRKHSSYFATMLQHLGMNTAPEFYFSDVPWEVLAAINHSFLLSERKRYFLRYVGGLLYTEISVPASFRNYSVAAQRLGYEPGAMGYWDLHIKEDERHGRWMLNEVALPLCSRYPEHASELVLGYDQQRAMSGRAGQAIADAAQAADMRDSGKRH